MSLIESEVDRDPVRQFQRWLEQAIKAELPDPHAMTLATSTPEGRPSARVVLLRGVDERGFVFFTNSESRKGRELASNPWAALVFYWHDLERQVRIEGRVEEIDSEDADAYFESRPRDAQLGAWASNQSDILTSRAVLEARFEEISQRFSHGPIPRPPHWGGYRVIPDSVEFWQGRPARLHDRLLYRKQGPSGWVIERLAP
jgi:pyridoxamine 5'-phosphate oxidase